MTRIRTAVGPLLPRSLSLLLCCGRTVPAVGGDMCGVRRCSDAPRCCACRRLPRSTSTDLVGAAAAAVGVAWVRMHRAAAEHQRSAAQHCTAMSRIASARSDKQRALALPLHTTWRQSGVAGHRSTLFPVVSIRTSIDPLPPTSIASPRCREDGNAHNAGVGPSQRADANHTAGSQPNGRRLSRVRVPASGIARGTHEQLNHIK